METEIYSIRIKYNSLADISIRLKTERWISFVLNTGFTASFSLTCVQFYGSLNGLCLNKDLDIFSCYVLVFTDIIQQVYIYLAFFF